MNKKIATITVALVALAFFFAFWGNNSQQKSVSSEPNYTSTPVKIGYRAHIAYAPLFVGLEKSYFDERQLVVEPVEFESTNQMMEALLAGRIDAALGGVNNFVTFKIEEKSPNSLKIFSLIHESPDHPSSYLITKKDSAAFSLEDLQGANIGSYPGSTAQIIYRNLVKAGDLKNTELSQMSAKLELQALVADQIDAAIVLEPLASVGEHQKVSRVLEAALLDKYMMKELPMASSILSTRFIEANPEQTISLVDATNQAIDFINNPENENEVKAILSRYLDLDDEVINKLIIIPYYKLEDMRRDKLQEFSEWMLSEGEINREINSDQLILDY